MAKKLLFVATILFLTASVAMAAGGIDGKWSMSQQASNGGPPRVTTFDLKAEGTSLSGTVTAPMGGRPSDAPSAPVAITNAKASGNSVTFDVVRTFAGNPVTTKYECAVSGDTMRVKQTIDLGKGPQKVEAEAKRVTP